MRRSLLAGLCVAAFGIGGGAMAWAANLSMVAQRGRAFSVGDIAVARGGVVRFTNEDGFRHQIFVQGAMSFESDEQVTGQVVDIAFPSAGVFEVRCHIHPKMLLRVDVR